MYSKEEIIEHAEFFGWRRHIKFRRWYSPTDSARTHCWANLPLAKIPSKEFGAFDTPTTAQNIDDRIDAWHGETAPPIELPLLHQYLGLSRETYAAYVENGDNLWDSPAAVKLVDSLRGVVPPPVKAHSIAFGEFLSVDRQWWEYPVGTKAHALIGGYWFKTGDGWKWNGPHGGGVTFPTPGGDACGKCIELPPVVKHPHPLTNACYARAGMRLDNQVDELDQQCRALEDDLAALKRYVGICPDCGDEIHHWLDEPFGSCSCGTGEWTFDDISKEPLVVQRDYYKRLAEFNDRS